MATRAELVDAFRAAGLGPISADQAAEMVEERGFPFVAAAFKARFEPEPWDATMASLMKAAERVETSTSRSAETPAGASERESFQDAGLGPASAAEAARLMREQGLPFESAAVLGQCFGEPCSATPTRIHEAALAYRKRMRSAVGGSPVSAWGRSLTEDAPRSPWGRPLAGA